jgi:ankyrin repeat protein
MPRISMSILTSVLLALLLGACASNPKRDQQRNQALIQASRQGNVVLVKSLVKSGADMNAVDAEGWTPYLAASVEGNWSVMKYLQGQGAKTDPGF